MTDSDIQPAPAQPPAEPLPPPAAVKPYHDPVAGPGRLYTMDHLNPLFLSVNSNLVEEPALIRVRVRFSNHCFTVRHSAEAQPEGFPVLFDHNKRARSFCKDRYGLSKDLPGIVGLLGDPKTWVHNTAAERNWCYAIEICVEKAKYHIFFEIKKAAGDALETHEVEIFVESAYAILMEDRPKMLGKVPIGVLVGKTYLGQRHYFPRK